MFVKVNRSSEGPDKFDAEVQGLNSMVSEWAIRPTTNPPLLCCAVYVSTLTPSG